MSTMLTYLTNRYIIYITILGLWQVAENSYLPGPFSLLAAGYEVYQYRVFWEHFFATMSRLFVSVAIAVTCSLIIGILVGYFSKLKEIVMPIIMFFFPIPKIVLLPIFFIWFGFGEVTRIIIISLVIFYPSVIYIYSYIQKIPKVYIEAARVCGAKNFKIIKSIVLPYILPPVVSSLRTSFSLGMIGTVVTEIFNIQRGLGFFVEEAANSFNFDHAFVGVFTYGFIGLLINYAITLAERHCFKWQDRIET